MYICVWIVWLTNCLNDTLKIGFDRWINVECFLIFGKDGLSNILFESNQIESSNHSANLFMYSVL